MKTLALVLLLGGIVAAHDKCPMPDAKSKHQEDVETHGDAAMGFPHDKTAHHFRLSPDGGVIEVTVNDVKDTQNLDAIRMHLKYIRSMFAEAISRFRCSSTVRHRRE